MKIIKVRFSRYPLLSIIILICFAGIIREDVDKIRYIKLAYKKDFDCVGKVMDANNEATGSCVLISKKYALSAAHLGIWDKLIDSLGGRKKYVKCIFKNEQYKVVKAIVHPQYINKAKNNFADLVILELEKEVTGVKWATLYRELDEKGRVAVGVGYGRFATGKMIGVFGKYEMEKIAGKNIVDSLGGNKHPESDLPSKLFVDMDNPKDNECCNAMGQAKALDLEYIPASGDSGGGLFIKRKRKWLLAGITGGTTNYINNTHYGNVGYWTRVSTFAGWIKQNATLSK